MSDSAATIKAPDDLRNWQLRQPEPHLVIINRDTNNGVPLAHGDQCQFHPHGPSIINHIYGAKVSKTLLQVLYAQELNERLQTGQATLGFCERCLVVKR